MKLELVKIESLEGKITYNIKINGLFDFISENEQESINKFNYYKTRISEGFPKNEILESFKK